MRSILVKFAEKMYTVLYSECFKEQNKMRKEDFTRQRKLNFAQLCLLILKSTKRGSQAAIQTFLKETKSNIESYSKAAFCKARQKINPRAFRELFEMSAKDFYEKDFCGNRYQTYRGFRICAIDGSDLNLPNTEELLELYGSERFSGGSQVQAQISCLYDVLNGIILDACIEPCRSNEREMAIRHFDYLHANSITKELVLLDRGYPSEKVIAECERQGLFYIMRANKNNFFREIRDVKSDDEIITRPYSDGGMRIRVIEFQITDNVSETLITNIFDPAFSIDDFKEIYHLRWGIETRFNDLKNKFQIENFSGINSICVLQDFYSVLFLSNLLAYMEADHMQELKQLNSSSQNRHQYIFNTSLAIFTLKDSFIELVIADSAFKKRRILKKIQKSILKCLSPVRKNRSFLRALKHPSLKFPQNKFFC